MITLESGHISRKAGDDSYRLVFYLGVRPNGKAHRVWRRGRGNDEQAERHRKRVARELMRGHTGGESRERLDRYLDTWIDGRAADGLEPKTIRGYRRMASNLSVHIGAVPLLSLEHHHAKQFKEWGSQRWSPKYVRDTLSMLLTAIDDAVEDGKLADNRIRRKKLLPKVKLPPIDYLEVDEIGHMLEASAGTALHPLLVVLCGTGLRIAEALGSRVRDGMLESGHLTVQWQLKRQDGRTIWDRPKTEAGTRTLPVEPAALRVLREIANSERVSTSRAPSQAPFFARLDGSPVPYGTAYSWMERLMARLGWEHRSFHTLRHTYITHMLRAGVDPKTLALWVGHTDGSWLVKRYGHAIRGNGTSPSYFDGRF